jgi:drug/metabolite transporter (DMT)-like permease
LSAFVLAAVLLGALFHATWNAIIKSLPNRSIAAEVVAVLSGFTGIPVALALSPPPPEAWPYLIASSLIHIGYFTLLGYIYRSADLSVAYPMTRGSAPLLTAIVAFILIGENMHWSGWLAVSLIALGIAALSFDALLRGGLNWKTGLAVAAVAGIIVCYTMIDGIGTRKVGNGLIYGAWLMMANMLTLFSYAMIVHRKAFFGELRQIWPRASIAASLQLPAYATVLWAMTKAPIGLVAALREVSVVFAAIIGAYFFGERFGPQRWLAVALIIGGVMLLRLPAS